MGALSPWLERLDTYGETKRMPTTKAVLLAGEVVRRPDGTSVNGARQFVAALTGGGYAVTQVSAEDCGEHFPRTVAEMASYDALVLSDVGALSLLLTPDARAGRLCTDRLIMVADWGANGGGLVMAGGYMSFQGMDGLARYFETPIDDCLPVTCRPASDGLEAPAGLMPLVVMPHHPVLKDVDPNWPPLLGMNKTGYRTEDADAQVAVECTHLERRFPLLATRPFGRGRTLASTSDIAPHWLSQAFADWESYDRLMRNMIDWVTAAI